MYVKKLYHESGPQKGQVRSWQVGHTGVNAKQHFKQETVHEGLVDGLMVISGNRLMIRAEPEDLKYTILRRPGRYCHHCAHFEKDEGDKGESMRAHVEKEHKGIDSPEPSEPAGYTWIKHFVCVLDSDQQSKFQAKPGDIMTANHITRELARRSKTEALEKIAKSSLLIVICAFVALMTFVFGGDTSTETLLAANLVFNISLGQVVAYYRRVDENDPSTAVLVVSALAAGTTTDDQFKDFDTLSACHPGGGGAAEATNSGYARKIITDADIVAFAPDDTNNRVNLVIVDQTWTAVAAGTNWSDLILSYDSVDGAGTDTNIVPLTLHDFVVVPDGSDITADVSATLGFFQAQMA